VTRHDRWNALLELLATEGRLDVEEAAGVLDVSAATIRRDLDQLAARQLLLRTRGGAVAHGVSYELPLRYKTARHAPEKQRIAEAVAGLLAPGEVVGFTGGTTTTGTARALALRDEPFTVVTNALNIAGELAVRPQVKIVLTGGVARPQSYELIGPLAMGVLREVALDVTVLGVNGIDPDGGLTAHHEGEAEVNRALAERARRVVVAADSSKAGSVAFARICPLDAVDVLVTDVDLDPAVGERITEAGVRVMTV
jgi:DeoR family transcriptional regulator of aga operon